VRAAVASGGSFGALSAEVAAGCGRPAAVKRRRRREPRLRRMPRRAASACLRRSEPGSLGFGPCSSCSSEYRVRLFPTVDAVLPAQRSEHAERRCPVAQQGFPGCQLDKPTWRYLTSRRRFSCICRFPLGFLSHVSGRERVPSRSLHEHLARCCPATSSVGSYTQNTGRRWRSDALYEHFLLCMQMLCGGLKILATA
jgi:hypothetical protein